MGHYTRSRKKHFIVSPMCPREMKLRQIALTVQAIDALVLPSSVDKLTCIYVINKMYI